MSKCVVFSGFSKNVAAKCLLHSAGKNLQTDNIFSCFAASSSNTPGWHCRERQEKTFFETNKLTTRTWMYLHVCSMFDRGKSASIDVTKGVGGVDPNQLYYFFFYVWIVKNNYSKKIFYCSETYTLMFEEKTLFPGAFNSFKSGLESRLLCVRRAFCK